ncbi:lamin tail domain-containing protein [Reichenbachiella agarivorans]|uniref:Lamin tail domain-containing protein n=1 Tax=Reichenbachiella agarivorans TaxID=2979464 RepID=A0ABY6CU30_9BACT|nr:lamin tail domain-containing protein [Reichenbachiella agarivorans]UXP33389.1 lamin tail domain-containing protein [Reichenbachiella agarivorans]
MKYSLTALLWLSCWSLSAQVNDDFSDGDFTASPVWSGDVSQFEIEGNQLNSNGPSASAVLHLSTANDIMDYARWEFLVELKFAPSGTNKARIYLVSNRQNLEGDLNGYFIEIGQSNEDYINFYRQDGSSSTLLFTSSTFYSGNVLVRIQITRSAYGVWSIAADPLGGSTFDSEGVRFVDNTYTATSYFGVVAFHTSTNKSNFYFDDIHVTTYEPSAGETGPIIDSLVVSSANLLELYFAQNFDVMSVTDPDNYKVGGVSPISVFVDSETTKMVNLIFQSDFDPNKTLKLEVNGVKDESGSPFPRHSLAFLYDTSPPKIDHLEVLSSTSIKIKFKERVERQSAETRQNYEYDDVYPMYVELIGDSVVVLEFRDAFVPETLFDLYIDEVEDWYGNAIQTRIKTPFVYDILPPRLDSAFVKSPQEIVLLFHERLNESISQETNRFLLDGMNPSIIQLETEFGKKLTLNFAVDIPVQAHLSLHISEVMDMLGNKTEDQTINIDSDLFRVGELVVLNHRQLKLVFNNVPSTTGSQLSNYLLTHGNIESVAVDGREVCLTFAESLILGESYELNMTGVADTDGRNLVTQTIHFDFDPQFVAARIIGMKEIEMTFSTSFDINGLINATWFALANGNQASSAIVSSKDSKIIRLIFADNFLDDQTYTLSWQTLYNEHGNAVSGFTTQVIRDQTVPSLTNLTVLKSNQLQLHFSEPLLESSAEFTGNYQVDPGIGFPHTALYNASDSTVLLTFGQVFQEETEYALQLSELKDLSYNQILPVAIPFQYFLPYQPAFGELIISEIMSSPTEGQVEFVELYNASDHTIELTGLTWHDGSDQTVFTTGTIEPNAYILLAASATNFSTSNLGKLAKWLTLNNSGETLSIYAGELLVFSTNYTDDWYGTAEHLGMSLEMVDLSNFCGEERNWTASQVVGGTPGTPNSQSKTNPDNFGPKITQSVLDGADQILIQFNEKLYPDYNLLDNIKIEPHVILESVDLILPQSQMIQVSLLEGLNVKETYTMTLEHLKDCVGNVISNEQNYDKISIPEPADSLDLLINEILFNPKTGGVDFVEIYNHSDKVIDLQNWHLASVKPSETISKMIHTDHLLIQPEHYMVFTSDPELLKANYPISDETTFVNLPSFPSYNDDEGIVVLMNPNDQTIDYFEYFEDYHSSLLDDEEGVSLERISFDSPTNDPNSWFSAASTSYYATPGLVNSQFVGYSDTQSMLSIEPKVFIPDGSGQDDFTTISYQLDQPGGFANLYVFDTRGRIIKALAQNQLLSTSGFMTWDGSTDQGNLAPVGYYIVFAEIYDTKGNKKMIKETVVLGSRL